MALGIHQSTKSNLNTKMWVAVVIGFCKEEEKNYVYILYLKQYNKYTD